MWGAACEFTFGKGAILDDETQCSVCLREQMAEGKYREKSVEEGPWVSRETTMQGLELHGRELGCEA